MTVLKLFLIGILSLYLIIGIGVYIFQERLIFLPEQLPRDFRYEFDVPFEEHFVSMEDGAEINALHFKVPNSKGLILYFHGNAGSLERWGHVVMPFVDLGYDVLIMDYRGYGKSTGTRSNQKLLKDAEVLYQFALEKTSEDRLILFGRSIGSSFASNLAGKKQPKMLILETPFYRLRDVARKVLPIYPTRFLLKYDFDNAESLMTAKCPIHIFHGTEDEVVPYESGQKLYQSLDPDLTKFYTIEEGRHNNLSNFDDYWSIIKQLL